jgi:hypothetical protein
LFSLFFSVFFGMLSRQLRFDVRIKFSPLYPHFGGASSPAGGRVELYIRRMSQDLAVLHVLLCVFRSVSSDLPFSLMMMVAAPVRWSFVALAR